MDARKEEETQSIAKGIDYSSFSEKKDTPLVWLL